MLQPLFLFKIFRMFRKDAQSFNVCNFETFKLCNFALC